MARSATAGRANPAIRISLAIGVAFLSVTVCWKLRAAPWAAGARRFWKKSFAPADAAAAASCAPAANDGVVRVCATSPAATAAWYSLMLGSRPTRCWKLAPHASGVCVAADGDACCPCAA